MNSGPRHKVFSKLLFIKYTAVHKPVYSQLDLFSKLLSNTNISISACDAFLVPSKLFYSRDLMSNHGNPKYQIASYHCIVGNNLLKL